MKFHPSIKRILAKIINKLTIAINFLGFLSIAMVGLSFVCCFIGGIFLKTVEKEKHDVHNNQESHAGLAEFLVFLIQSFEVGPFEELLKISKSTATMMTNQFFIRGYEKEDLMQEARSVLIKSTNDYAFNGSMEFMPYYQMNLRNHFNMLVRRQHAHKRKINKEVHSLDCIMEDCGEYIRGTSSSMTIPESVLLAKDVYERCLVNLSSFERDVFRLGLNGTSINETATTLGCTAKQVKDAWYRCGVKFKDEINE